MASSLRKPKRAEDEPEANTIASRQVEPDKPDPAPTDRTTRCFELDPKAGQKCKELLVELTEEQAELAFRLPY